MTLARPLSNSCNSRTDFLIAHNLRLLSHLPYLTPALSEFKLLRLFRLPAPDCPLLIAPF